MRERPLLQLALDVLETDAALEAARRARDSVEVIEAGTLLCLSEGMAAVRTLRREFPDKTVVGDVRIVRAGGAVAEMAFDAGADWVTVVGEAPPETVEAAVRAAEIHGGEIQVELNRGWTPEQARQWLDLGVGQIVFHHTAEAGSSGGGWSETGFDALRRLAGMGFRVTAAGGIRIDTVPLYEGVPVFAFVAGRAIVEASDPAAAAARLKDAIGDLGDLDG